MGKRIDTYCGPLADGNRSDLAKLEERGIYLLQSKIDGWWGELGVKLAPDSFQHRLVSRAGLDIENTGLNDLDLGPLGGGTRLVLEVDHGTEAANERLAKLGYVCGWLHDILWFKDHDLRDMPYHMRWELLRDAIWPMLPERAQQRLPLVECTDHNFTQFYDRILANGGEGVVAKDINSVYASRDSNGKTPHWIRIKPWRTVDYFVIGDARTDGGNLTVQLGLMIDGKPTPILKYQLQGVDLVNGKLVRKLGHQQMSAIGQVIEMRGRELFKSGALRAAQPVRWRDDKMPEMCTGLVEFMEL
jgi:hypothetical protein